MNEFIPFLPPQPAFSVFPVWSLAGNRVPGDRGGAASSAGSLDRRGRSGTKSNDTFLAVTEGFVNFELLLLNFDTYLS